MGGAGEGPLREERHRSEAFLHTEFRRTDPQPDERNLRPRHHRVRQRRRLPGRTGRDRALVAARSFRLYGRLLRVAALRDPAGHQDVCGAQGQDARRGRGDHGVRLHPLQARGVERPWHVRLQGREARRHPGARSGDDGRPDRRNHDQLAVGDIARVEGLYAAGRHDYDFRSLPSLHRGRAPLLGGEERRPAGRFHPLVCGRDGLASAAGEQGRGRCHLREVHPQRPAPRGAEGLRSDVRGERRLPEEGEARHRRLPHRAQASQRVRQAPEKSHRSREVHRREFLQQSSAVASKETQDMSHAKSTVSAALVVAAAAGLAAGCQTTDPYTGEMKTSSATFGALIGAGTGAAIGMISGHDAKQRRQRALVGAGVGALAGGAVGGYMDKQESELRALMRDSGVTVTRKGEDIVLNMPGNITFRTGSADLNAQFFKVLDGVAQVARKYDKTIIEIAGHTDNVGGSDYNRQLSQRRASAVSQYLTSKGVAEPRIMTAAGGEEHPIASNSTEQGRAANRRVEVTLAPLKEG